jgi:Uma2 family endonuclease
MSIEEFLPILIASEVKLELIDGYVVPFANGTAAHGLTAERLVEALSRAAGPGGTVFSSKVAIQRLDAPTYVFPDVSYTSETVEPGAEKIFSPSLVVEVVSPLSVERDRVDKLDTYQAMPSIQEYLIVDSRRVWACIYRRRDQTWLLKTYGVGDTIELLSIGGVKIDVNQLYAGTPLG